MSKFIKFKLDYCIIIIAIIISLTTILFYLYHFCDESLSGYTSDWGAFGSYMSIAIGSISIALLFITFREQSRTNKIVRFEQHLNVMKNTIKDLIAKNKELYDKFKDDFYVHFETCADPDYTQDGAREVIKYYYHNHSRDIECFTDDISQYLRLCLQSIQECEIITQEEKYKYTAELSCMLTDSVKLMLFCNEVSTNSETLKSHYYLGYFNMLKSPDLLNRIIEYVCINRKMEPRRNTTSDIEYTDDYLNEPFPATYKRLNSK